MHTAELISYFKIKTVIGTLPTQVTSIHDDSREVEPGSMFICTKGYTVDGHDFYQEAIQKGASVIVSEKYLEVDQDRTALVIVNDTVKATAHISNLFYQSPSNKLDVIGVTGTNGKTTVTTLIHSLLKTSGKQAALLGTNGLQINDAIYKTSNTTCNMLTNQKLLAEAVDNKIDHMVMEVSSHGLAQGRLWGINFDVVVFTNLSQDHLDYHHSMEQYGYVKGLLFAQLGQDLINDKYIVLNQDDQWFSVYNKWSPFEVISYGIKEEANFKAEAIEYLQDKTKFVLKSPQGTFPVETSLLGEFNIYNILAAMAALFAQGLNVEQMVKDLKTISSIKGRMERLNIDTPVTLYLDYAHTPDAIEKAIHSVLPFKTNKLIFLAGTAGERDRDKRALMAEKASIADYVVLTVQDPRHEDPNQIVKEMEKGMKHEHYACVADRNEAIRHAVQVSEPGDIIIFAGNGHEDYQIIANKKIPHSEFETIKTQCFKKYPINNIVQ
ncbi:UDP-N-acetylmuramoyl-L-alanyl-D-glutamate--2,6-diaminopimelate ligase [Aquibacillus sediminis]|uniref:UDP-N-acetylmuramoyl-L-alanyl-D-glutamate--2, 6-diaminopimelate ligase n=1 Tax=Aquibacillus sediminis TaxID=2574734 RepID=UPI0011080458|nr:UDP-N-acetylmuramoyl-L-alanyl-D-glutamate--2,6-diaminopimelate ligase [Aquibacillus sediminis]